MLVLPMSVARVGPLRLPFSGGGYLRLLPGALIRQGFRQFEKRKTPVVVYLHPRDFATDCPRVPMPLHRRFMCYVGIKSTEKKLKMLLGRYAFTTCADLLGLGERTWDASPAQLHVEAAAMAVHPARESPAALRT
jgi:hypothetical protein